MTRSSNVSALELFLSVVTAKSVQGRHRRGRKVTLYSARVVTWLMIAEYLLDTSMAGIVGRAQQGAFGNLIPKGRRQQMSLRTGGYAKGRARLCWNEAMATAETLYDELDRRLSARRAGLNRPVKLLDGSSLELASTREMREAFPPARNQHGPSHWSVLRMVALLDAETGVIWRAAWGPMYGAKAVSEQGLAQGLIDQLPETTVLLGDCNFGIFHIAWHGTRGAKDVVLRLTRARAQALARCALKPGTEIAVCWKPSARDRRMHSELPAEAEISGRVVICQHDGWREPVYLFTSLSLPADEVVKLYGLRWNVETDLRSLKRTINVHRIDAKSADMMQKELLMAIAAYNITRAVMCLAAQQAGIAPRDLSFTHTLYVIEATIEALTFYPRSESIKRTIERMIRDVAQCTLPKRKKRRSYPRAVWKHRLSFPPKQEPGISK